MSPKGFFYLRYLQWKMYFSKNPYIKALFYLENYLFENYNDDENIISNLKIKWIYDHLSKGDFSNEITKNLIVLNNKNFIEKALNLIELYSDLISSEDQTNFIKKFMKFNNEFNSLLELFHAKDFKSLYLFQLVQFKYVNKLNINHDLLNDYFFKINKDSVDIFELVFIEIFLKKKKNQN